MIIYIFQDTLLLSCMLQTSGHTPHRGSKRHMHHTQMDRVDRAKRRCLKVQLLRNKRKRDSKDSGGRATYNTRNTMVKCAVCDRPFRLEQGLVIAPQAYIDTHMHIPSQHVHSMYTNVCSVLCYDLEIARCRRIAEIEEDEIEEDEME